MIDDLDTILLQLFRARIPALVSDFQVRFEPPNADWRAYVDDLSADGVPERGLNVYLVDLTENRELRTVDPVRSIENGQPVEDPPPTRVDCHYLISAWDSAKHTPQVQPTRSERRLLDDALGVLLDAAPLNASDILTAGLGAIDPLMQDADLPTEVVPTSGFAKLAEFWGSMSQGPWKPSIYVVVTVPVASRRRFAGPPVTTLLTEYDLGAAAREIWIQIGGHVVTGAGATVPNAWVRLETMGGLAIQTTQSDDTGAFTFVGLTADRYRLRYRAPGRQPRSRDVTVPEPSGEYDLRFP